MPYKIVLHAPHGSLDQITVNKDHHLKRELHRAIEDWVLHDQDSITIFEIDQVEVDTDKMFNDIVTDLRSKSKDT